MWANLADRNLRKLVYYNGARWKEISKPEPRTGFDPPGFASDEFRFVSSSNTCYVQEAGHAWSWSGREWIELEPPPITKNPKNDRGLIDQLIVAGDHLYFVMHNEPEPISVMKDLDDCLSFFRNRGSTVWFSQNGSWTQVRNRMHETADQPGSTANLSRVNRLNDLLLEDAFPKFERELAAILVTRDAVGLQNGGFILDERGDLLRVTSAGIEKIEAPSSCDAIARSSRGTLLAFFHDEGLFEFSAKWTRLMDSPSPAVQGNFKISLASDADQLAVCLNRFTISGGRVKTEYNLWVSHEKRWQHIELENSN
jgi:hypothetical protein